MSVGQDPLKEIRLNGGDRVILSSRLNPGDDTRASARKAAEVLGADIEAELPQGLLIRLPEGTPRQLVEPGLRIKVLPEPNILSIGDYRIDVSGPSVTPEPPSALLVPDAPDSGWMHHLAQLIAPPSSDWIDQIEQFDDVTVVEPVSRYGLYLYGNAGAVQRLRQLPFVAWTGPFQPAYRIGAGVLATQGNDAVDVFIYPVTEVAAARQAVLALGGGIVREDIPPPDDGPTYAMLTVEFEPLDEATVYALARIPSVRWLELPITEIGADGELSVIVAAGIDPVAPGYQAWLHQEELSGKGVVIAIADSGVDLNEDNNANGHPDLRGRQRAFDDFTKGVGTRDQSGHGTLVASVAVGNAAMGELGRAKPGYLLGQGVAPAAEYVTQNISDDAADLPPISEVAQRAASFGAHILNISANYGLAFAHPTSSYSLKVSGVDRAVRNPMTRRSNVRELVIVGSAGNAGPDDTSIGRMKEAKNIIAVGAGCTLPGHRDCVDGIWHSSSRGPAMDGRHLPCVIAPGIDVTGARAKDTLPSISPSKRYCKDSGTSYAAPIVSGMCALLIEWWQGRHGGLPSAAMLKALLINAAVDMRVGAENDPEPAKRIPNHHQGWGQVNLLNILHAPTECRDGVERGPRLAFDQEMPFTSTDRHFQIVVKPCRLDQPLRITLVWTDAPGDYAGDKALKNDLDLEVNGLTSGTHFVGNMFANGFSMPFAEGESIQPDDTNNVECVYIEQPNEAYAIQIRPQSLVQNARFPFDARGWQDFALVIDNAVEVTT